MKLSTRGRYGLKLMYELGKFYGNGPIALRTVAEKQNLSENYLEQLAASLRKSQLINSVRGAQGGYLLARTPEDITVGEILRSLEGDLSPVDCLMEESDFQCSKENSCPTKPVWTKIRDSINNTVDSITLLDMLQDSNSNIIL